jgi:hypothetical protein
MNRNQQNVGSLSGTATADPHVGSFQETAGLGAADSHSLPGEDSSLDFYV